MMNEYEIEMMRLQLGVAAICIAKARSRQTRDEDLIRAADAVERATIILGEDVNDVVREYF
ncbi:hypothetical protein WK39_18260 [Burkholderia cepacia]|uniref:hypothetical protein n=1 Tax=Burkholderia cepacia TaxID=292 RepID=UPI00075CA253|nr:hypothetical protein [Burkholderia cepacia]KVS57689.1 hypothetical protein WK39_18260 [Burkholderia cepacia]KVS63547.1 hypothetical protein WK40_00280 [Burkholderia cepacia]